MDGSALESEDMEFWRAFLGWSQGIHTAVNRAVSGAAGLSVPEVQVLNHLRTCTNEESPQLNLMIHLDWSASRISHLLNRLEGRAFIDRADTGRGRARTVRLTRTGKEHLMQALDAHGHAVRESLLDWLSPEQRRSLEIIMTNPEPATGNKKPGRPAQ